MDFRLIRRLGHFLAIAEEGHFGRAARRLGISQPPLTAQLQALEAELGVRLIERSRKGARPTREGEALLPLARRLAEDATRLEGLARELRAGRSAPLALACVTSALFDFLPPLVRGLRAARPDLAVAVRELDTADALEALRRAEVDVALIRLEHDRPPIRILALGDDALVVALPQAHPLARGTGPLPLAALTGEAMVMLPRAISPIYFDRILAACRAAGFEPLALREVGSAMAQLGLCASGLGVALVSSGMAALRPPGVAFRTLEGPVATTGVALAWNEEAATPTTREAVALARALFPAAQGRS